MASRCVEFEELIDREARGWSEADRLRIERHLGDCEGCRHTLGLSRVVRDTISAASELGRDASIERALTRALDASTHAPRKERFATSRRLRVTAGSLALAAAAALLLWFSQARQQAPVPQPTLAAVPTSTKSSVLTTEPEQTAWIETHEVERRTFAHASVVLSANARVRFDDANSELLLERGSVEVHVDPAPRRAFRVTTRRFRVEVLGTKFTVSDDSVAVVEGRVRVLDLQGRAIRNELHAGEQFAYGSQEATVSTEEPAEAPASAEKKRSSTRTPSRIPADVWLARAREALSRGNSDAALAHIVQAEASSPRRNDRAEALTLRAEAALVAHDTSSAIRLYELVASKYGNLTAGENGAFAAAQVAARSDPAHARILFTRYLARYPQGRFSEEAKKRLISLKTK